MSSHRSHPAWPGLPGVVKSRILGVGDLDMHIFECNPTTSVDSSTEKPPLVILLHGFPELAYSWRKIILPLAEAGYYVVAPDQRGYGLTRPRNTNSRDPGQVLRPRSKVDYTDDIRPYHFVNLSADIVTLIGELGYKKAEAVIGHDFGSFITGVFALSRPDLVEKVVLMSAPYAGPTPLSASVWTPSFKEESTTYKLNEYLKKLNPPRQHYRVYHSSPECNNDMLHPIEGLGAFLRNYYHVKSADWEGNADPAPHPLTVGVPSIKRGGSIGREEILEATARALEILPYYYVMPAQTSMPDALRKYAPSAEQVANNKWLPDEELDVYTDIFRENGFQGALNWYRVLIDDTWNEREAGMRVMRGKRIEVPVRFVVGESDWGIWQTPGALDAMKSTIKGGMEDEDIVTVKGAGHWVQQEQPQGVIYALLEFLKR